jgi:hypothetical protein
MLKAPFLFLFMITIASLGARAFRMPLPRLSTLRPPARAHQQHKPFLRPLSTTTQASSTPSQPTTLKPPGEWDLNGLRKETDRQIFRTTKKLSKKSLSPTADDDLLNSLRDRLTKLRNLEEQLLKKGADKPSKDVLVQQALDLDISDSPPAVQPRGIKVKGPKATAKHRKPFRTYTSEDGVKILVGKKAEDNDVLSCSSLYKTQKEWWLHASGCAGSHVIIKCEDENLPEATVRAAALLAARASKCAPANRVTVNLTRCRNVSKPPGAAAGMVQLVGDIRSVKVNLLLEKPMLDALDETCEVN